MMEAQKAIADIKACLETTEGFELDIGCVEELASINTIEGCIADFEKQLKRQLTDEEKNTVKNCLETVEKFNQEYINLQASDSDEELANMLGTTQEGE